MEGKSNMEFWTFASDDPALPQFCAARSGDTSLYCITYIEEYTGSYSADLVELLHLRSNTLLFIDMPLLRLYSRLQLRGRFFILSEAFCATEQTKVLLKFLFFHLTSGIVNGGSLSAAQQRCVELLCEEYRRPYDDLHPHLLRNLLRNLLMLSGCAGTVFLTAGHLLGYALQVVDLLKVYSPQEKKKAFYADKIGITEPFLTYVLQVVFDKTFREMLLHHTLLEASRLLLITDKSVTQIARELDYDASDFNKLFLKWKGRRPKDMRTYYRNIISQVENAQR